MGPQSPQHIAAGMAATNLVIISQILTKDNLPWALYAAVAVSAVTLPLNTYFYILDDDFVAAQQQQLNDARINILFARFMGLLALNIVGLAIVFFNFGILPGALFLLTSLILFRPILGLGDGGSIWRICARVWTSLSRPLPSNASPDQSDVESATK